MKIAETRSAHDFETMLPLINVVFLLLIFFMLAGSFSEPDFYEVTAPVADNDTDADRKELTVILDAQGRLAIDDASYTDEQLSRFVHDLAESESPPRLQLKADAQVASHRVLEILELLGKSGLESVRLLTLPAETG